MLVFFVIIIIFLIIVCAKNAIKIENLKIKNNKILEGNIYYQLYIFKIRILNIKIGTKILNKIITNGQSNLKNSKKLDLIKNVKEVLGAPIKIKNIMLEIFISTEDIIFTTYSISLISTILSSILPLYIEGALEKNYYKVTPIYEEKFSYEIRLSCIITIKTIHIIHALYLIIKKRSDEKNDDRTSNRKSYESSYE